MVESLAYAFYLPDFLPFFWNPYSTSLIQVQGICDSTIVIYNYHAGPICPGSGTFFQASPAGGVFSGPGVQPNGILPPGALGPGNYIVEYRVTGPGGCTKVKGLYYTAPFCLEIQ